MSLKLIFQRLTTVYEADCTICYNNTFSKNFILKHSDKQSFLSLTNGTQRKIGFDYPSVINEKNL